MEVTTIEEDERKLHGLAKGFVVCGVILLILIMLIALGFCIYLGIWLYEFMDFLRM